MPTSAKTDGPTRYDTLLELDARQDDVLARIDALDSQIMELLNEFTARLAGNHQQNDAASGS